MKFSLKKINNLDYDSRLSFIRISISKNRGGIELNELLNLMQEFNNIDHEDALKIYFENSYDPISKLMRFKENVNFDLLKISHLFLKDLLPTTEYNTLATHNIHLFMRYILFLNNNKNKNLDLAIIYILNSLEACLLGEVKFINHDSISRVLDQMMISLGKHLDFHRFFEIVLKIKPFPKQTLVQMRILSKDPELWKKIDNILIIENIIT